VANVGDLVRLSVTLGPTGRLGQAPVLGRITTIDTGKMNVLWENGVATENIPQGASLLEILTEPDPETVDRLFLQLVRYKLSLVPISSAEMYGYVGGIYKVTLDATDAPTEERLLVKSRADTYSEYLAENVEAIPSTARAW